MINNQSSHKQVFLPRSSIDSDWENFITRFKVSDPDLYLKEAELPYEALQFLELGISTVCNFDCPFCFNHFNPSTGYYSRIHISGQEVIDIVKNNQPISEIQLAVCGEPLMHKDLFQILEGIADHVNGIRISTNGSLLTPKVADRLSQFPITWMSVSAEAGDKMHYEKFRKNGSFEIFKKNISYAQNLFQGKLSFTSVLFNENQNTMLNLPGLCAELGGIPHIHLLDAVIHPKHKNRGLARLTNHDLLGFMPEFLEKCQRNGVQAGWFQRLMNAKTAGILKKQAGHYHHIDTDIYNSPCWIPFNQLNIDPEGNFNSCCCVDPKYGNALNTQFSTLYNDSQTLKLRVMNLFRQFPRICRRYCHKIPAQDTDISLENFRKMVWPFKHALYNWQPVDRLPDRIKLIVWPYGKIARNLLEQSKLSHAFIQGLVDNNPDLWGTQSMGIKVYSPLDSASLDYEAILITSCAYFNEILYEIEERIGLSRKKIYRIDLNQTIKQLQLK